MWKRELEVGIDAVSLASRIVRSIQQNLEGSDWMSKKDRSPVTVADFLAQAVVCRMLHNAFPDIPIVGEEDSTELRLSKNRPVMDGILNIIQANPDLTAIIDENNVLDSIDLGCKDPGEVFWTLDPIDGTKGFLRGEQFAVALALLVDGDVKLGILGCPNLTTAGENFPPGALFYAVLGGGTRMMRLSDGHAESVRISNIDDPREMRFVQSYVSAHGDLKLQTEIAKVLEIEKPPVQLDSQVKYGMVANGIAEIYLRIPHPEAPDYREKIWDHAAGSLIVREAGGMVSDIFGKPLDFSLGRTLKANSGILATIPKIQQRILEVVSRYCDSDRQC